MNRRKGMILVKVWLSKDELELIKRQFNDLGSLLLIGDVIEKANKRGDLKK